MTKLQPLPIDVVSIQSQVVYGCVGNSVAVPTMQSLGLQVASVPTIILSNTPAYPTMHGGAVPLDWFGGWLDDLIERGAMHTARAVQFGYLGAPEQVAVIAGWLERVRAIQPGIRIHVDPVLGDEDYGLYTHPGLVSAWHDIVRHAHGLTPNAFEVGQLTGLPTGTVDEVVAAAKALLSNGTEWVVVTSSAPATWPPGERQMTVVTRDGFEVLGQRHVDSAAKGTGDMFSAAVTAHVLRGEPPLEAARLAGEMVAATLERTRDARSEELVLSF